MIKLLVLLAGSVYAASIESCGGSGDVMTDVKIAVSPDPPKSGKDVKFTSSGTLTEDLDGGAIAAHLTISVLGNDEKVDGATMWSVTPAVKAGPTSLSIGDFKMPRLPLGIAPIISGN